MRNLIMSFLPSKLYCIYKQNVSCRICIALNFPVNFFVCYLAGLGLVGFPEDIGLDGVEPAFLGDLEELGPFFVKVHLDPSAAPARSAASRSSAAAAAVMWARLAEEEGKGEWEWWAALARGRGRMAPL